jgi:D-sedoheptulose 7-phosphate isomerase
MNQVIWQAASDAVLAAQSLLAAEAQVFIAKGADLIANAFESGRKILIAGNGGSLCDAMHFAEELTGQFRQKRKALAAIAIADPSHMSCTANDMGYDEVFSRYVEALGQMGDLLVVLTTSGNSKNLIRAVEVAKERGLMTIAFLGKGGGQLKGQCDLEWVVNGFKTSDRIQEAHMAAIHIMIEAVEAALFSNAVAPV